MTRKDQKFAGFRLYRRKLRSAYDSSPWKLETCSQRAATQQNQTQNQSGDHRIGIQGIVADPKPGLESGKQQGRLDLLQYIRRTLTKKD